MTRWTCSRIGLICRRLADRQCVALALLMICSLTSLQPAAAEEFELTGPEGTIIAEGTPLPEELTDEGSLDGHAFSSAVLGYPGDDAACQECPQDASCQPGSRCDRCAPPYGMVNRLIDNKEACWTLRIDALLLWRNAPRQQPLYQTLPAGTTALDAHQINSTPAGGPRFSLFRTDGCGDALEATYFRAANFRGRDSLATVADGYAPIYAPAVPVDSVSANLGSSIQSFELNGRMALGQRIQLLGGFRWVEWNESLSTVGTSTSGLFPYNETASIGCMNSLYGYQIGFDSLLLTTNWLRVEGLMKGGAYYNNAVATVTGSSQGVGPYSSRLGTPHGPAFVGEIGFTGVVPLHRNLDFRFGYLGLWLESLAQPTNQYANQTFDPAQPTPKLDLTGGVVLQGVTLGLEGRW
jgi:hypothetical protein